MYSVQYVRKSRAVRNFIHYYEKSVSGREDRATATETVELGLIPGRVKPKTTKIGICSFTA